MTTAKTVENIPALRILAGGCVEHARIAIAEGQWTDGIIPLKYTGRTEDVQGWGHMDGGCAVLIDDQGRDAYLVRDY